MTNEQARDLLKRVDRRLSGDDLDLRVARLLVKRAYDAAWAAEHPLPNSGRALADDAALYHGLRALGVKY